MAHFTWSIVVKHLAPQIDIFTIEDVRFTFTTLATVNDKDFYHFVHLLSRKQNKPASSETG